MQSFHRISHALARAFLSAALLLPTAAVAQSAVVTPRFPLASTALDIHQPAQPKNFFSVVGETGAVLGQQDGTFELWEFPVKLISHFHMRVDMANYAVPIDVNALASTIDVSPDHTTITYSHAAFTIRQHMFVPRGDQGTAAAPIVLFEISSVRPLELTIQFDPVMQRMWPALNPGRPSGEWVARDGQGAYVLQTDDPFFSAMIAMPGTRPGILPPYQEHPKDYPLEFKLSFDPKRDAGVYFPLVTCLLDGGERGAAAVKTLAERTSLRLRRVKELYESAQSYYAHFFDNRLWVETPDARFDQALRWAAISIDQLKVRHGKELGFVAGVYPSADSDRPGFGWFFGRDTLWSVYAVHSYGDFGLARQALEFLIARQRADGKIMHEFSQSAERVDWAHYGYQYVAADSSPLFVMAVEDYLRSSGDAAFLRKYWENVKLTYQFTRTHDSDGDGIYDNSEGTGWVESWPPRMPDQELYLAALDQQSCESMSRMARVMGDAQLAYSAAKQADLIRKKLAEYRGKDGIYAFSRNHDGTYDPTRTVYPSAAWWNGHLMLPDADKTLDSYAGSDLSADWGLRAVARSQPQYDPLSYHQGSVWPLFTGWASMAEFRTGRSLAGYEHLLENIDLTWQTDPGNVTELLSGNYYQPFGRSTAHQLWSSAMVISPALRGVLGIEADVAARTLRLDPQLPADWNRAVLHNVPFGEEKLEVTLERRQASLVATVTTTSNEVLCLVPGHALEAKPCTAATAKQHTLTLTLPDVEVQLPHLLPVDGAEDRAPRVTHQQYGTRQLSLTLEVAAGTTVALPVRINTASPVKLSASGAEYKDGKLFVKAPAGSGFQVLPVEVRW